MSASHDPGQPVPADPSEAVTVVSIADAVAPAGVDQPPPAAVDGPQWPLWQRVVFRYLFCHALLYSLPRPFSLLFNTIAEGIGHLAWRFDVPWLKEGVALWPREVATFLGSTETWWQTATRWFSDRGWTPVEVLVQPTGSGDTAHDYLKLAVIVALALLLTTLWSLLSSARAHGRLGRWLHLFARWDLAFWMLTYGLIKFYSGQFGAPELSRLTQEVGDKSPMGMVWLFMAASRPYELFGGLFEVLGGLLLFHRRTALLGCFVTIAVMANVCALNWLYDVPVKLFSTHLLLYAVFLLAPWRQRLAALLVHNTPSAPIELAVVQRPWARWALTIFGVVWVGCHLADTHFQNMKRMAQNEQRRGPRPELYGIWNVETMRLDGVEVPTTDATRWRFLAIDRDRRAWARTLQGQVTSFAYSEDLAAGTVSLQPQGAAAGAAAAAGTWTVERGLKTVKVLDPEPRTMADYQKQVDAERRTLVLKGKLGERQVELHVVERVFTLQRGFHWVQELPYHR